MKSKPDVDIIGPLSSVSEEQGAPSSSCWELKSSLPLPLLRGRNSVCPFRVCLIQSVSMETLRQEESASPSCSTSPFPKSLGLHCSPTMWQHCVTAALVYKQDNLHAIVRKTLLPWSIHWLSPSSRKGFSPSSSLICKAGETFVNLILTTILKRFKGVLPEKLNGCTAYTVASPMP